MNELISLLIGLVVGLGLFAIGVRFYPQLAGRKQGYPLEDEIERILLPYLYNAISSAYKVSEKAVDELQMRLRGADKAAIAREVYKMLPGQIGGRDISMIKNLIGEERFAELVQNTYNEFDRFFEGHQARFDELYEAWKRENAPDQSAAGTAPPA